ncbi:PREDICTED: sodium-independent sulfate anion transporter-like [Priapulus caudatus]|uniref:Sodium-independent sulfate anion transporter-like n=1 Tax=Priapulus caudatus TaxID=37621 RepID=A0ABM1EHQ1_PRICU|nr:PREDICTED: sodium-independent sulfate anion transporter-like [Priapulus caudatus]
MSRARNAVIVLIAAVIAYALEVAQRDPFTLTGEVNAGLPPFKPPNFYITDGNVTIGPSKMLSQLGSGLAVVPLIGILESIVIAKAFARKNRYKIDPTQELLALGLANILGSFVSAYPVTGSFSRTAVNSQSGVKTPAGGILTGVLALLALSFLSAAFTYIPQATLAAIIICAVASMFEYEIVAKIWRTKKLDLVPLFVTFLACLGLGIEYGIMAGVGVSLIFLLYNMARPGLRVTDAGGSIAEHGEAPPPPDSTSDAANHNVAVDEKREGGVLVMRPEQSFYFPATQNIADAVIKQSRQNDIPNPVIFDCSHISGMDFTSVQALERITEDFKSISQPIVFINLSQELLDQLARARIKNFVHRSSTSEAMIAIHDASAANGGLESFTSDPLMEGPGVSKA